MFPLSFTVAQITLLTLLILFFSVQMLYVFRRYRRTLRAAKEQMLETKQREGLNKEVSLPPVSLLIYVRDEAVCLLDHLPMWLNQDYPNYEIIVINDASKDATSEILEKYAEENERLYVTYIPQHAKYLSRKKLAFTLGIKAAKNDWILFTEPDSKPISNQWIRSMAVAFTPGTEIVLGLSAYSESDTFLKKWMAYDNILESLRYSSAVLVGRAFTGTGYNLAYRKDLFFKHKGYYDSLTLHAGEDDLFINSAATKDNTRVVLTPESIVVRDSIDQIARWNKISLDRVGTQKYYRGGTLNFYRMDTNTFFLFFGVFCWGLVNSIMTSNWIILFFSLSFYFIRLFSRIVIFKKAARILNQSFQPLLLPFFELLQPVYFLYFRIHRIVYGKADYTFYISANKKGHPDMEDLL